MLDGRAVTWRGNRVEAGAISRQAARDGCGIADGHGVAETAHRPSRPLQDALEAEISGGDDLAVTVGHRPFDDAGGFEQGPAGHCADALEHPSEEFLKTLYALPPSDAVKLAQGAVLQLQNSWRTWCHQQEQSHGLA